jgi:hydroxymethylbilane synthase
MAEKPIIICTRGSALALVQANLIAAKCRAAFPHLQFELKIIKTTGDKMQKASLVNPGESLPKGLFTKELEVALAAGEADLAVHSLKDLPTDLPPGLVLAATPKREDVRDVLIYRMENENSGLSSPSLNLASYPPKSLLKDLSPGAVVATSSTRRKMSVLAVRPDLAAVEIRGTVSTRLHKIATNGELAATLLAMAGLSRLKFTIASDGELHGDDVPPGLGATVLELDEMLPCVGQGAIGIETRAQDERILNICSRLNDSDTFQSVTAERSFLQAMGGGCQSPVGAYASIKDNIISLRAISFLGSAVRRAEASRPATEAVLLGRQIADELKANVT